MTITRFEYENRSQGNFVRFAVFDRHYKASYGYRSSWAAKKRLGEGKWVASFTIEQEAIDYCTDRNRKELQLARGRCTLLIVDLVKLRGRDYVRQLMLDRAAPSLYAMEGAKLPEFEETLKREIERAKAPQPPVPEHWKLDAYGFHACPVGRCDCDKPREMVLGDIDIARVNGNRGHIVTEYYKSTGELMHRFVEYID